MPNATAFTSRMQKVEPAWTDYNGHLNMAYYPVLFDRAGEDMFEALGLGADYVKVDNCTTFTLETHTTYLNELKAGEEVRIECQILAHDQKRIHYVQQMFRGTSDYLACVLEVMLSHVDMKIHRTSPFPPHILSKIAAMAESHKGLPVPPQVGHKIGLPPPRN